MQLEQMEVCVRSTTTIRETMMVIDRAGLGIALVVNGESHLLGMATDGDIRRAILRGVSLERPIAEIMNRNPHTVTPLTDTQEIRRLFVDVNLKHVPVVDAGGKLVDLRLVRDLLAVPLSNPDITDLEQKAVIDVLRSGHLSLGPKVAEFEEKIAAYAGRKFAIAVNSGTSGLHLIVKSLGLGAGDEVITTPFSFIASSNCLLYEDVTPVFVDIEPDTYNIDPKKIEAAITPRTRAILTVDVFGQPAHYDEIGRIAQKHGLKLISDSCESIGAEYKGRRAGSFGAAGVFAFYPNKQITTGEGGIIVTDDPEIARLCRSFRNQGRGEKGGWLAHERLGYNYRLSDISCALGIVQLARIDEILTMREKVSQTYRALLRDVSDVHMPFIHPDVNRMSWFVFVVRLANHFSKADRDDVILALGRQGIGANTYFQPIHLQPFYRERFGFKPGDFPVTEAIAERTIALPFHNHVSDETAGVVIRCLREALAERRSHG